MSHARKPYLIAALALVALLASACSSLNAAPTPSLQEMQLTAQAAAAMTLTAQAPSPTPVTPSPTPIPVIPTVEPVVVDPPAPVIVTEVPVQPVSMPANEEKQEQDCSKSYISAGTEGPRAPVSILNKKGASVNLSYYLEPSPFGQCGSGSVSFSGDSKSLSLPVGCYYLYAWVTHNGRDQSFKGYSCLPKKGITWLVFPDRFEEAPN